MASKRISKEQKQLAKHWTLSCKKGSKPSITGMAPEINHGNVTVTSGQKIEVKVGSGSVIVEESELHNLIEALSEMRDSCFDFTTRRRNG